MRLLRNPFLAYAGSFSAVLLAYQAKWSRLYSPLRLDVVAFLGATVVLSFVLALLIGKKYNFPTAFGSIRRSRLADVLTGTLLILAILQVAARPDVPLLLALEGRSLSKEAIATYGIPLLAPTILTLSSLLAVHYARLIADQRAWSSAFLLIVNLTPSVAFLSRGTLAIIFLAAVISVVGRQRKLRLRTVLGLGASVLLAAYSFGALGNVRVGNPEYILRVGRADPAWFSPGGGLPSAWFWPYLYATSPVANLDLLASHVSVLGSTNVAGFLTSAVLPNAIARRMPAAQEMRGARPQVSPALTAGTAYANALLYLGWPGAAIVFSIYCIFVVAAIALLPSKSAFSGTGIAFLSSLSILMPFDNMLVFTGAILPVAFSIVLAMVERLRWRRSGSLRFETG